MKPHEWTWAAMRNSWSDCSIVDAMGHTLAVFKVREEEGEEDVDERAMQQATLAAQAPAMARILFDVLVELSNGRRTVEQDRIEGVLRDAGVIHD